MGFPEVFDSFLNGRMYLGSVCRGSQLFLGNPVGAVKEEREPSSRETATGLNVFPG